MLINGAMGGRFVTNVGSCTRHVARCVPFGVAAVPRLGGAGDLDRRRRGRQRNRLVLGLVRPSSAIILVSRRKRRFQDVRFTG